jgi:hypothetical protein
MASDTSIPPYVFLAWCLIKHRDSFTFLPLILSVTMKYQEILIEIQVLPIRYFL